MGDERKDGLVRTGRSTAFAWLVLASCCVWPRTSAAQERPSDILTDTRTPYVRVFDTAAALPGLLPSLADAAAWAPVKEGDGAHSFAGDAVLLNDRLVVLLRRGAAGAQVYAKTPAGLKLRAEVVPCLRPSGDSAALASVRLLESKSSAATLEATFKADDGASCSAAFRLATGDVLLEARAGAGTARLALRGGIRYVVVPDYFGDDMVLGANASEGGRVGLPAENLLLSLMEGGDSIVMCVWTSSERNADLVLTGAGGKRAISGCEVEWREGESIWVAVLEGAGIWHDRALAAGDAGRDLALDWQPPFPAKWRGDLVGEDGVCESWEFVDRQERERQGGPPTAAESACPCYLDSAGAHVRPHTSAPGVPRPDQNLVVVYPMDRDRATPLTRFCPVDVMRNALGVGPCQYILELEGFAEGDAATAAEVTRWIEKQFEKKKDAEQSAAIKQRLEQMVSHMASAQARIEQYGGLARQVQAVCKGQEASAAADTARRLVKIALDMERNIADSRPAMATPAHVRGLADSVLASVGQGRPLTEVQAVGEELRLIGAAQDGTLSRCRLAARRLKQECRTAASGDPRAADLVAAVREQTEKLLQKR